MGSGWAHSTYQILKLSSSNPGNAKVFNKFLFFLIIFLPIPAHFIGLFCKSNMVQWVHLNYRTSGPGAILCVKSQRGFKPDVVVIRMGLDNKNHLNSSHFIWSQCLNSANTSQFQIHLIITSFNTIFPNFQTKDRTIQNFFKSQN